MNKIIYFIFIFIIIVIFVIINLKGLNHQKLLENYNKLEKKYDELNNNYNELNNKIYGISTVLNSVLVEVKKISNDNNGNNDNFEYKVTEDNKKIIKDSYRRDFFILNKYAQDIDIEKFVRKTLINNFPNDRQYSERNKWEIIWFKLRAPVSILLFLYFPY